MIVSQNIHDSTYVEGSVGLVLSRMTRSRPVVPCVFFAAKHELEELCAGGRRGVVDVSATFAMNTGERKSFPVSKYSGLNILEQYCRS